MTMDCAPRHSPPEENVAINKRKVLDAARRHAQKGAKQKALREYGKLIAADPRDAKLLLEMGDVHRRWGQLDEAVTRYTKVASRYREEGFDARAVAVLKQILALDPKRYDSRVDLAELYQRMGLDSDALVAYQSAADGYYQEGQRQRAVEILQRMVSLDPGNTTSRLKVADMLWQEGLSSEAISEFEGAADELARQGGGEEAITIRERILEMAPDHVSTLNALANELIDLDEFEKARPLAERALELAREGEHFELLCRIHKALGEEAPLAELTREMAEHYRSRGDEAQAREVMQRLPGEVVLGETGIDTLSESQMDLSGLASGLASEQESGAFVLEGLEEADDLEAVGAEASRQLADEDFILDDASVTTPIKQDEIDESEKDFELVVDEVEAADLEQRLAESRVYLRYGKYDEARVCLQDLTQTEADHPMVWQQLARVYSECGEKEQALEAFNKALSLAQDLGSMSVAFELEQEIGELDKSAGSEEDALLEEVEASGELTLDEPIDSPCEEPAVELIDETETESDVPLELSVVDEPSEWPSQEIPAPSGETGEFDSCEQPLNTIELSVEDHWAEQEVPVETPVDPFSEIEVGSHQDRSLIFHEEAQKAVEEMTSDLFADSDADEDPSSMDDLEQEQSSTWEVDAEDSEREEVGHEPQVSKNPEFQDEEHEEGDFDLAAELAGVFEEVESEASQTQAFGDTTLGEGMRSLFSDFKQGVKDTLGEADAETRFDLAIAYREMGLFEDAAGEFQICTAVPSRRLESLHMLGLCVLELGRGSEAKSHIEQALAMPKISPDQEAALRFDLGRVEMVLGEPDRARRCFDAVAALDPLFPGLAQALVDPSSAEGSALEPDRYESFEDLFPASEPDDCGAETTAPERTEVKDESESSGDLSDLSESISPAAANKPRSGRRKRISFI